MRRYDIRFASILSPNYPPLLREIHDPPFALYWRGTLPNPEIPLVGIVGTRSPSGDGALCAARLGREFAECGVPVVSGLARGIDAFAHRGAVDAGGVSIAVLACGVERIYPRSNVRLAERLIARGGCIMGEYPMGETPQRYRFPERNRIISGLSRSVIVVEAPAKSGALITADFALEQGRDLYVCADVLHSLRGAGTERLHGEGAPALRSALDLLNDWGRPVASRTSFPPGRQCSLDFGTATDLSRVNGDSW